jgi:hypothetical protein
MSRTVSREFLHFVMARLSRADQAELAELLAREGYTIADAGDEGLATAPNSGVPQGKLATDPPSSERQRKAMWAAAKGQSNIGIPRSVGKEFVGADMAHDESSFLTRWPECARIGVA